MSNNLFTTSILVLIFITITWCLRLDEDIGHYEALEYDAASLRDRHERSRRSVYDKVIHVDIKALGREMRLRLHPDTETFHPETIIEMNGVETLMDQSHLFKGVVEGVAGSKVVGSLTEGIFQGRIELPGGDKYQVERAEFYKHNEDLRNNKRAHSVIYHHNQVDVNGFFEGVRKRREADKVKNGGYCGNEANIEWMKRVQKSAVLDDETSSFTHQAGDNPYTSRSKRSNDLYSYYRQKRQASTKTTCNLFLQADPELWDYFAKNFGSREVIREQISSLFQEHVDQVTHIYTRTTFQNGNEPYRNYGFRVDRVLINETCSSTRDHAFCSRNIDASNLLNLNSYRNHDNYCLAYVFTYRDFEGGTLGLAWVAEKGKVGGVCSTNRIVSDEKGIQRPRSLNTGIITLNNYDRRVKPLVSKITFAHELGHNFGSPHDEEGQPVSCTPYSDSGSADGNFIMFASATEGTKPNNDDFSTCSKSKIGGVLSVVVAGINGHRNCFKDASGPWCGNTLLETGEGCDCGYTNDCATADCCKCCIGQNNENDQNGACQLKQNVICDPSQGPCCNKDCGFIPASADQKCESAGECTEQSNCDGNGAGCPKAVAFDDGTPCNGLTQICKTGVCTGSICELVKTNSQPWSSCDPPKDENDPTALCFVACHPPNNSTCYKSSDYAAANFHPDFMSFLTSQNQTKIPLPAGHICDKDKGFCDHFQKCRQVNAKGPLARLKDLIFSESTLNLIRDWVTEYWWAVALIVVGFIGLMIGFVQCCAVHTPSSNPAKPKARKVSQTLTLRRRQAAHQPVPSGGARENLIEMAQPSHAAPPQYSAVIHESAQPPRPQQRTQGQTKEQRRQQYEMQQQQLMRRENRR